MKYARTFAAVIAVVAALGCGQAPQEETAVVEEVVVEQEPVADEVAEVRHDQLYVCNCGPDCDCGSASLTEGTCGCGKELVQAHLLKVEGNDGILCTCSPGCTCELDAEDPTKCGCGEAVKRVSFEGKGLYYCNCGSSCSCNFVAAEPGTCACGMELTTS